MHPDDTLRKLALPLALAAAFLASSASLRPSSAPRPLIEASTLRHWHAAYDAAAPLLQMGN